MITSPLPLWFNTPAFARCLSLLVPLPPFLYGSAYLVATGGKSDTCPHPSHANDLGTEQLKKEKKTMLLASYARARTHAHTGTQTDRHRQTDTDRQTDTPKVVPLGALIAMRVWSLKFLMLRMSSSVTNARCRKLVWGAACRVGSYICISIYRVYPCVCVCACMRVCVYACVDEEGGEGGHLLSPCWAWSSALSWSIYVSMTLDWFSSSRSSLCSASRSP